MQAFLEIGLSNAVMAAILALVAAGAGFFCRRPAVRHILWLLVLLKLVTPPLMSVPVTWPSALDVVLSEKGAVSVRLWPSELGRADLLQANGNDPPSPHEEEWVLDIPGAYPASAEPSPGRSPNSEKGFVPARAPGLAITSFLPFVFTGWLLGAVSWFSVAGIRVYRFQRLLRYGKAAPALVQDQTRLLAERLGLARCPIVWLVPGRVSPLLWSLGKTLYLVVPADLLDRLGREQRASLLAHELAHARRRDHWVRWLEFVVLGLYWWLPVAWWARRRLQQAEEECCDAWVVWTLPAAAKAYAKALLQTVDFLDARPALPPVASGIGHVHYLKRRLTMIVRQPLCPQLPWPVYLVVVVLGLLVLPLAPQRVGAQDSDTKPVPELSDDTPLVREEQDPANRDLERRMRILEERMDRLLQKLEGKPSGRSEERPSEKERGYSAGEKARAKEKEKAEKAMDKAKGERMKELKRQLDKNKTWNPEQLDRLKEEIDSKVRKAFDPERIKEIQKRIEETVDKSISPERMEEIQRRIDQALKKSSEQLNEALKRSTEQLERAKRSIEQAKRGSAAESRPEKPQGKDQRDLERRMDRLEQKMDRVLQALEKQGKSGKGV